MTARSLGLSMNATIRHVSDTALWVAVYRGMESERPDALFHDPWARRLAGARGEAIVAAVPRGKAMAWPMIVRTAVMDEIVMREVASGVRTVLNLAAGLDARPWRLPLPADLRWIHVDLPDMVAHFRDTMDAEAPRCRVEYLEADLRDAGERERVLRSASGSGRLLVVTEGLLIYLEPEDVARLADDLATITDASAWLSDLASPMLLKFTARTLDPALQAARAPFRFAPAEGTAFFAPHGWEEFEFRSSWLEGLRLNRTMPFAWLWRILAALQPKARRAAGERMAGIVLLKRSTGTTTA